MYAGYLRQKCIWSQMDFQYISGILHVPLRLDGSATVETRKRSFCDLVAGRYFNCTVASELQYWSSFFSRYDILEIPACCALDVFTVRDI